MSVVLIGERPIMDVFRLATAVGAISGLCNKDSNIRNFACEIVFGNEVFFAKTKALIAVYPTVPLESSL